MTMAPPRHGGATRRPRTKSAVTAYAEAVGRGKVVTGRLVRLACERHLRDIETGHLRGLWFDEEAASRAIAFPTYLTLSGGDFKDKPFILEPVQAFIVGSLFGWKRDDGSRRFRVAYVEMGKGNGKSPLAAAIGLYMVTADGEERAEVYSAAVDRDQAQILFRDAVAMVDRSPALDKRLTRSGSKGKEWNLAYVATGSFFRPISSEHVGGRGKSGFRVHAGLLDEVHEHPTSAMVDFMRANAKGRQPLILEITNSGYDRSSVCYQHHDLSVRVLEGIVDNDAWFAYVCTLDLCEAHRLEGKPSPVDGCPNCDDWRDEKVWPKVNPLLDVSVSRRYLRELVAEAVSMPGKRGIVQRLNFCIWTQSVTRWIQDDLWMANAGDVDEEAIAGKAAYAGVIVSAPYEIFALIVWVPDEDGGGDVLPFFWVPQAWMADGRRHDTVPYDVWVSDGYAEAVEGEVLDFEDVRKKLTELAAVYDIREVGVLRYNAVDLMTKLQADGFEVYTYSAQMKDMSPGTKELGRMLTQKKVRHGGHPVLRLHAANMAVKVDADENMRPDKEASTEQFPGIEGLIVAIGRALAAGGEEEIEWGAV